MYGSVPGSTDPVPSCRTGEAHGELGLDGLFLLALLLFRFCVSLTLEGVFHVYRKQVNVAGMVLQRGITRSAPQLQDSGVLVVMLRSRRDGLGHAYVQIGIILPSELPPFPDMSAFICVS